MFLAYYGISWQISNTFATQILLLEKKIIWRNAHFMGFVRSFEYDTSIIHLPRQQCAFSKESSKYAGCGILKRDFYTRFIPIFKDFGLWHGLEKNSISVVERNCRSAIFFKKEHNEYYFKVNWSLFEVTLKYFKLRKCEAG